MVQTFKPTQEIPKIMLGLFILHLLRLNSLLFGSKVLYPKKVSKYWVKESTMDRRPYTIWWRKLLQGCDYTFHYFLPPPIQNTHFDQASLCQNSNSLKHVPEWIQIIREHVGDIPIFFIGNNIDLAESRIVSREEGINLVTKYNLYAFSEISTKTGENVEGIFQTLSDIIIKRWE